MTNLPGPGEFNQLAAHFDRFLPLIHPVSVALLARLPSLGVGQSVLDVACGTGEPSLTLARSSPGIRLVGVDQAEALIIDSQRMVIHVRQTKTRRHRIVPLSPRMLQTLREYWRARPPEGELLFRVGAGADRGRAPRSAPREIGRLGQESERAYPGLFEPRWDVL